MDQPTLAAATRTGRGTRQARYARKHGQIPAVVYGHQHEPVGLSVDGRALLRLMQQTAGETVLISLQIAGDDTAGGRTVIIKDVQQDPVRGAILHVDFQQISLTEKIHITIPIETKGEPVGVQRDGGLLEHFLRDLSITCLPTAIPHAIELDVSALGIGDSIHVHQLPVLAGDVDVVTDGETVVLSVIAPRIEEEPEPGDAGTEPEVIARGKDEAAEGKAPTEGGAAASEEADAG
jgi:large subunit ribosomal protein L25